MYNLPIDINLCSGAGGLALGLSEAGFDTVDLYDKDSTACETLRHNLQITPPRLKGRVFQGDLTEVEWFKSCRTVRLLAAGAPCQPFSAAGARKGHEDSRNLFPTVLTAVRVIRPKAVLVENVRGLAREAHRPYLEYVVNQLRFPDVQPNANEDWTHHDRRLRQHAAASQSDYRVSWRILNAADFGVPQIRYRLFIVATSADLDEYTFPTPTHSRKALLQAKASGKYSSVAYAHESLNGLDPRPSSIGEEGLFPWVTVREAISGLPDPSAGENESSDNHWLIPGARSYPGHTGSSLDWPSKTLKAGVHGVPGGENSVVQDDNTLRYYTLREMARLQTFPDKYFFKGARSTVTRQIGNAVPCKLASAVAGQLSPIL